MNLNAYPALFKRTFRRMIFRVKRPTEFSRPFNKPKTNSRFGTEILVRSIVPVCLISTGTNRAGHSRESVGQPVKGGRVLFHFPPPLLRQGRRTPAAVLVFSEQGRVSR